MKQVLSFLFVCSIFFICPNNCYAGVDPLRASNVLLITKLEKKTAAAQAAAQGLVSSGHYVLKDEVRRIVSLQTEFNNYLNAFRDFIPLLAEVYGLYYETKRTVKNIKEINQTLASSPANAVALVFSAKRGKVYQEILWTGLDVINDVRSVIQKDAKMTEHERLEIIQGIRTKMKKLNKKLQLLNLAIRYTTFGDVWREINGRYDRYTKRTKRDLANECFSSWRSNFLDKSNINNILK